MISVCMATYNGAAYIERQLRSILCQLAQADEVILVDDGSSDATLDVVKGIGDARIKIFRNDFNEGIIRTFERSLRQASGDIIYLSDQDDIWYPGKVRRFMEVFDGRPDVTLVLSDAKIINDADEDVAESYLETRGGFSSGIWHNIVKNKYLGCTMAFRRSMMDIVLPIPQDVPMHDVWIGCVNSIYGKTHLLNLPLMAYRRHQYNATPSRRRGIAQILVGRWRLVKNLCLKLIAGNKVVR
jgi:glycosyltransferase involved in cell wall biosynthesis